MKSQYVCISACLVVVFGCAAPKLKENVRKGVETRSLPVSVAQNTLTILRPEEEPALDSAEFRKLAVFVTGTTPLYGGVAEDLLKMRLRDAGFIVEDSVSVAEAMREVLKEQQKTDLREQLNRLKEVKKMGEDATPVDLLEKRLQFDLQDLSQAGREENGFGDMIEVGKKLALDAIVVGSIFEARLQFSFPYEEPPHAVDILGVSSLYVQVIHVGTERPVLGLSFDYMKGESLPRAMASACTNLVQNLRGPGDGVAGQEP